jgi:hypothetical protein
MQRSLGLGYVDAWIVGPDFAGSSAVRHLTSWADYAALKQEQGVATDAVLWAFGAYTNAVHMWGEPPDGLATGWSDTRHAPATP